MAAKASDSRSATLRKGRARLALNIENAGPFRARVLAVRLVDAAGLPLERLHTDSERNEAPTLEGVFRPLGEPTLDPGEDSHPVYLTVSSRLCMQSESSASWALDSLDFACARRGWSALSESGSRRR